MVDSAPDNENYVCHDCCVAPLLQELVVMQGSSATCSLCGAKAARCADTTTDDFLLAIKALIRYHFGEWQYHSKLGDGSLETLFFIDPNPILKINPDQEDVDREGVILSFLDDINTRQMQVEVFTAYGRDIYNYYPHTPISAGESNTLGRATAALAEKNYFLVEDEYEKLLRPVMPYVSTTVAEGTRWHRARMGATLRAADFREVGAPPSYYYEPHKGKSLGSPPVGTATIGRVNRPGVSYLYLASDASTATAEIRPHPAELVSVGCFDIRKNLRVVDLRTHDLRKLWRSDAELEMLEQIIAMEKMFSTAAPPSNRGAYTTTQFLGEIFRRLDFEGVIFRSTVGQGDNLVIFDPAQASWVEGSSRAIDVKKVSYELVDVQLFDESEQYDVDYSVMARRS
ncbi:MAG: RES domain-containing protein [Burkholderiales bacterium]|nr:MAG: RES domain-containing protein [Burkholderiales bacterium]